VVVRPLHIEELAEVLAMRFEAGKPPEYHSGWRLEDGQDTVLSAFQSNLDCQRRRVTGRPFFPFLRKGVPRIISSRQCRRAPLALSHSSPAGTYDSRTGLPQRATRIR
jgi:hypothetical protein